MTTWEERALREASMGKTEAVFRLAGACVGNGVLAGERVLGFGSACGRKTKDLCKSSLSAVGRVCARPVRRIGRKREKITAEPSEVAAPVRAAAAPAQSAPTETEEIVSAPAPPAKGEAEPIKAKKARPRDRSRAAKPTFAELTAEQVETAEFGGVAQKVLFRKALSDLKDGGIVVRARAAKALGEIAHELSVQTLGAHLFGEPLAQVRKECINALVALDLKKGLPPVEQALDDSDGGVRLAAVMGVYRLAGAAGASTLIGMLRDENAEVRRMVTRCIGWMGQEHQAIKLVPLLSDGAVQVRRAAVEAMGNLGDRRVVSALIECLNDADDSVRRKALGAVEGIAGKRMSEGYPEDEEERERLLARWRHWWRGQANR